MPHPLVCRKDLYAVKLYQKVSDTKAAWVTVFVSKSKESAINTRDFHAKDRSRQFPLVKPKLVHPLQATVDAYLIAGNAIS
jgi:hypothetical protein